MQGARNENGAGGGAAGGPARWARTKEVLGAALELTGSARDGYVEAACGGDTTLLSEVRALLRSSDTHPGSLREEGLPAGVLADAVGMPGFGEGAVVGRYRIVREIGSGGMGAVFEAVDDALGRKVALKLLSVGLTSTGARRRFAGEAVALARLDHPGIARVYEAGVHDAAGQALTVPYFAMAFVEEARSLDRFVAEERPGLRDLVALFARVSEAVHHGHQKGVLHRDLKPSNILVDRAGGARLIDFGVSRLLDVGAGTMATRAGDIVGTPAYLPPEAFEKGVHSVDTRGDVYALGVVMYEVLSGANPFAGHGQTPLLVGERVCKGSVPQLGAVRADCRGDIETVVAKAMAREPEDRYQSAEQLGADLRRVLAFEPVLARPAPLLRQVRLFARRNRAVVVAAGLIVVALGVGVTGLAVGLARAREGERRAHDEAERAKRVAAFVMQMLRSASPFQGEQFQGGLSMDPLAGAMPPWPSAALPGRAPTVGDLIGGAVDQLEGSFPGDLALQADVAAALAQSSIWIADPRNGVLTMRAAELLERAYGRDDVRTLTARNFAMGGRLNNGDTSVLPDIERDMKVIRALPGGNERLLEYSWNSYAVCMERMGRLGEALPVLREVRGDLDRLGTGESYQRITLDMAILKAETADQPPSVALRGFGPLEDRARALEPTPGRTTLALLFARQFLERADGDTDAALATLIEGTEVSRRRYGGLDPITYEWLSNTWAVAMPRDDFVTAERVAREQVRGAEAMLGPHSLYTTKAYGRLARSLLAQGRGFAEAERAARLAVEGAPGQLEQGEDWAQYHELLWAWAARAQGDAERAQGMIRAQIARDAAAGRLVGVEWVEILRCVELAQCEMDLAEEQGDLVARTPEIERLLERGEHWAGVLGPDWPSVKLVAEARGRFATMSEEGVE